MTDPTREHQEWTVAAMTMQGVVEPQTEAGRALLDGGIRDLVRTIRAATGVPDSQTVPGATREMFTAAILAIENEAAERMRLRPIEAETLLAEARAALDAMATRWEAEADERVADPKAKAESLMAAGILRSHVMSVRAVLHVHRFVSRGADGYPPMRCACGALSSEQEPR